MDVGHLREDPDARSGVALIAVAPDGENTIIVSPGANGRVGPDDVEAAAGLLADAAVTLVQLEIPEDAVRCSRAGGGRHARPQPGAGARARRRLLARVDVLVPNRGELELLAGPGDPADAARRLAGPRAVVVTLGADGVLVVEGDRAEHVPARRSTSWTPPARATPSAARWPTRSPAARPRRGRPLGRRGRRAERHAPGGALKNVVSSAATSSGASSTRKCEAPSIARPVIVGASARHGSSGSS